MSSAAESSRTIRVKVPGSGKLDIAVEPSETIGAVMSRLGALSIVSEGLRVPAEATVEASGLLASGEVVVVMPGVASHSAVANPVVGAPIEIILPEDASKEWTQRLWFNIPHLRRKALGYIGADEAMGTVKERMSVPLGIPAACIRFLYAGRKLDNKDTMRKMVILYAAVLHVIKLDSPEA